MTTTTDPTLSLHTHPLTIRVALVSEPVAPYPRPIREPRDVYDLLHETARTWDRERIVTLALDTGNRILGLEEASVGLLNATLVHPREIFKALILVNAAAFIVVHNHPSGDPKPSENDYRVTRVLREAGEVVGIPLLDHVIIGHDGYTSLQEEGVLPSSRR